MTDARRAGGRSSPAVFEAIIPIDNPDLRLQPGLRGFAKIDAGHSTLAWWLWRMISKTFHFSL
jgi:putative peptide zinc metalloprotease protein